MGVEDIEKKSQEGNELRGVSVSVPMRESRHGERWRDETSTERDARSASPPDPPRGLGRVRWLGPGILWMVAAAGSGELLFTPRIGSLYGYTLLWALLAAVALKWFINREVGRYTVCTGESILRGFERLGGKSNWALWLIVVPQLFVAVITLAGLSGAAATALDLFLPGDARVWMVVSLLVASSLTLWGRYEGIEKTASVLAAVLCACAVGGAASVFPPPGEIAAGLVPDIPDNADQAEILPWIGFALSGAAGFIWYSYWLQAKGYGAAGTETLGSVENPDTDVEQRRPEPPDAPDRRLEPTDADISKLRGWLRQLNLDNSFAVVSTLVITAAFLVLGVELLRPRGLLPEEDETARTLGELLGQIWGPVGFWIMVGGVFVGLWQAALSNQDGFARMFADGTALLAKGAGKSGRFVDRPFLKRAFVVVLLTVLPIALYLARGKPIGLLKISGAIEAAHIPVVAWLALLLNRRHLHEKLRPNLFSLVMTAGAGLFFAVFALIYLFEFL